MKLFHIVTIIFNLFGIYSLFISFNHLFNLCK